MKQQRDGIITFESIYEGETFQSLDVKSLHTVTREAVERCKAVCPPLARRYILRATKPLEKRNEAEWVTKCLENWFTKKWNDFRRQQDSNASPTKKRAIHSCNQCRKALHCLDCEEIGYKVFISLGCIVI